MIRCPQCGCENALGHIFCIRCRAKLDIQSLDEKTLKELESRPKNGRRRRMVWMMLFAGIVCCAALALWPMPFEGRKVSETDARQARKKILLLEKGLSPASQIFTEREINAYLAGLLREVPVPPEPRILQTAPRTVEAVVHPNAIAISTASVWGPITVGSLKVGPLNVTSRLTVVPERSERGIKWSVKSGRIGHLPLPGPARILAVGVFRPLLGVSFRERSLLSNASYFELEEGQITIATKTGTRGGHDQGPNQ